MIITRLSLKNFGVYAGINTFEFKSSKPVVLIGGMNGRGKTTFLEAVLLALYGANSFAYTESKYHTYGQYLRSYVNAADQSLESYVELEFKLESDTLERYSIKRAWSSSGRRTREKITVLKNNEFNSFLTDNWALFMENILPSGLSNFFFFDGEKIAELADESTNEQMKQSIKALLGITVLDVLENDLNRVVSKVSNDSDSQLQMKELEHLRAQKDYADSALKSIDESICEINSRLQAARKKLEKTQTEYIAKGGDIVAQRQDLFSQRNSLLLKIEHCRDELYDSAAGELPLILVKPLIEQILTQSEKEQESRILGLAVSKMNSMFEAYTANASRNTEQIKDFISYVEETAEQEKTEIIYDISDQSLYQIKSLLSTGFIQAKGRALRALSESNKSNDKVNEIDSYLSVDIDENALTRLYKRMKTIEQEILDLEVELEGEQKKRVPVHGDAIRANTEYNKYLESFISELELNDDSDRIIKYAHLATQILDVYKVRLQERKIGVLASAMTDCYKKLANKKNLIERIEMDPVTLDFVYLNYDGEIVPKDSLSAGEKQLMVISLLWALAICSKKKLPVIIDTPLSRMDSDHRISLITTYFPQASEQTIILSTDSEIDKTYYQIMKENVGDEFTLVYDDIKKCSTIQKGYFIRDNYDT